MILFVIRHGDPNYASDVLTPRGRRQAEAIARRLATHGVDRIFSSPLGRARETAAPTAELFNLPVEIEDWTSESHTWSEFTFIDHDHNDRKRWIFDVPGWRFHEKEDHDRSKDWRQCRCLQNLDGDYRPDTCYDRLMAASDAFLEKLGYRHENNAYTILQPNEERIALFCHAGFIMCWFPYLLGIPPHLFWSAFDITHTGLNVIHFKNDDSGLTWPRCLAWNDLSHIHESRLPLLHNNRIPL